jgi:predicted O-linked N-acetylglucosamine transferase (SPINDLY family)
VAPLVPHRMTARLEQAIALHRAGQLVEAERSYEALLVQEPRNVTALLLLSEIQRESGRFESAARAGRAAVAAEPANALAHYTLAEALRRHGALEPALEAFQTAVTLAPGMAEAHLNAGVALQALGRASEAVAAFRQALAARPGYAEAHLNLGVALHEQRRFEEAIAEYEAALALRPDDVSAQYSIGVARFDRGDLDGAVTAYERALALRPEHEESRNNLAYTLQVVGRYGEAAEHYRWGVAHGPNPATAARYLALASLYDPAADPVARDAEQRQTFERRVAPGVSVLPPAPAPRDPERRLRIGYLTADFCDHPVARNVEPLLAHRDRSRFEVVVYADIQRPDGTTQRLRALADQWQDIAGLTDDEAAARIRQDCIDILVCLAGHFDRNRPWIAARRPAPVQISFHDLLSSGLEAMDYFIADRFIHARGNAEPFSERVLHLPSFYSHAPPPAPEVSPLPAAASGFVTFACFNNPAKVNDTVLALWGRLLRETPGSRLVLKFRNWYAAAALRERVRSIIGAAGVEADRVSLESAAEPIGQHLARYAAVDVALDPFPFSGSTTTFEALWMGVPVVTLAGATLASRWSGSMLRALKLEALVARGPDEYVAAARGLANDLPRLKQLRAGLRPRLQASPLCNGPLRARQVERLYRAVWRRACKPAGAGAAAGDPVARGKRALAAGRLDEAVAAFLEALEREQNAPETLFNLGVALAQQKNFSAAADAFRGATLLKPDFAEAHANLGAAWRSLGRFDAAEASLRTALRLAPDHGGAQANLGLLVFDQGRTAEAIAVYDRALERDPGQLPAWRNRIAAVLYDPRRDEGAHRQLLERFAARFVRPPRVVAHPNPKEPERRLRIGYLSSDFVDHPIARNLAPVLEHRDRQRFEVMAYAEVARPDATTERLRKLTDGWRWIAGQSDEAVAATIREDRIDILVCLAGRLDKGRPLIAAQRAAPVQISFHDPGTSGIPGLDYLLADPVLAPRRSGEWFSERVVRLPWFYVHAPLDGPPMTPPPSQQCRHITFGSFNNPAKLNDEVIRLWARLLRETPRSTLVLKFRDWFASPGLQSRLRALLMAEDVDPARLHLGGDNEATVDHLQRYADIDIALDPFPFTGSTTTFEALWMGVPVVTWRGAFMAGRWSASMLASAGLRELIADNADDYAAIVAQLANYPDRLAALRASLRERVRRSPLCDGRGRARQVERVYRAAWRRWCAAR